MRLSEKSKERESVSAVSRSKFYRQNEAYTPAVHSIKHFREIPRNHASNREAMFLGANENDDEDLNKSKEIVKRI